jgi:hypothetical protein
MLHRAANLGDAMSEPIDVEPPRFFEFITRPGLVVVFLSLHPALPYNDALTRHLRDPGGGPVPRGRVVLVELLLASAPAFAFLQQGVRACGVSRVFDVLPGYYLFEHGRMIAWESGFPTTADLDTILGASLLGAIGWVVSREPMLVAKAVYFGACEAVGARMAAQFERAAAEPRTHAQREAPPPPIDELLHAYRLLGIDPSASDDQVNTAWRKRQAELHPDRAARDPAEFERRSRIAADLNRAREIIRRHRARTSSRGASAWSAA